MVGGMEEIAAGGVHDDFLEGVGGVAGQRVAVFDGDGGLSGEVRYVGRREMFEKEEIAVVNGGTATVHGVTLGADDEMAGGVEAVALDGDGLRVAGVSVAEAATGDLEMGIEGDECFLGIADGEWDWLWRRGGVPDDFGDGDEPAAGLELCLILGG